jgi:hypothetical protein
MKIELKEKQDLVYYGQMSVTKDKNDKFYFDGYGIYFQSHHRVLKEGWRINGFLSFGRAIEPDPRDNKIIRVYNGRMGPKGPEGFGTGKYSNGDQYEGDWKENNMHG